MQQKKSERPQLFLSLSFQSLSCGAVSKEEGQSIIFPLKAGSRGGGGWGGGRGWLQLSVCWHAALHARFTLLNSSVCPPIHSREIRLFLNMQTKILQIETLPEAKEEETLVKLSDSYTLKIYECPNRLLCTCKFYI